MNSLKQLIDAGIAPMRTTSWGNETPGCIFCNAGNVIRSYNNIYGPVSGTHMDNFSGDKLIITGSLLWSDNNMQEFLRNMYYHGVEFPMPLVEWIDSYGYVYAKSVVNGAVCLILTPKEELSMSIEKTEDDD